jgi:hypothetical protein
VFAGLYYWFPKMFGRITNERLGKIHFWGTVVPFSVIFLQLFILGAAGDHRRIVSYQLFAELAAPELQTLRLVATVALVVMLLFQGVFLGNFFYSMWRGRAVTSNPWRANTLEWAAPSPPPHGNVLVLPEVYRPPYEYSGLYTHLAGRRFVVWGHTPQVRLLLDLAAVFVLVQGYEWGQLLRYGMTLAPGMFAACFCLVIGIYGIHAVAAVVLMGVAWQRSRAETLQTEHLQAMQIFWYFVVGIWPVIYFSVYF